jgi:hypothetical protein
MSFVLQHTGGGRRPTRKKRVRRWERIVLGLAAGGAFAYLAWEPPRGVTNSTHQGIHSTAERRAAVTEDGARPHFDSLEARPSDRVASGDAQSGIRDKIWRPTPAESRGGANDAGQARRVADVSDASAPDLTVSPHSRGPP